MPEYYSIGTHTPMTAALGDKNQHYFRAKRGYALNPETELHQYVKTILKHRFDTEEKFPIRYYRKDTCPFEGKCIFYDKLNGGCGMLEKRLFEYDLKQYYDTATKCTAEPTLLCTFSPISLFGILLFCIFACRNLNLYA